MHPKKFIKTVNESFQQYQDGLITEAEWLAKTQHDLNIMIVAKTKRAMNDLSCFGIKVPGAGNEDKVIFEYKVKFYEEDGTFLDTDGFAITVDEYDAPEGAEEARDEASHLADERAEEMMIQYDAHSYKLTLENVG